MLPLLLVFLNEALPRKLETKQLPIGNKLAATFPNVKASCFAIASREAGIILHEKDSWRRINSGTFSELIFVAALFTIKKAVPYTDTKKRLHSFVEDQKVDATWLMNEYARNCGAEMSIFSLASVSFGSNMTTPYDMCCIFDSSLGAINGTCLAQQAIPGGLVYFFKSVASGVGCAFTYTNKSSCKFLGILAGLSSERDALHDVGVISKWLDQFFIFCASRAGDRVADIPVLYGKRPQVEVVIPQDSQILMAHGCSRHLLKIYRYRTILPAPVSTNDEIGIVIYVTEIFRNPLSKPIKPGANVARSDTFHTLLDSFTYVIYGTPYAKKFTKKWSR
ncbi:MAG: hypothetical protein LBF56_02850 [Holosporales bacterium]|nr:hypothetical protein [Holosporales bacterium]